MIRINPEQAPGRETARMARFLAAILLALVLAPAQAEDVASAYPQAKSFFPEADRFGAFEGSPRAAPAYQGGKLLGWLFLTSDVVRIPAYSGKPINSLVGFDLSGTIRGIAVVAHEEPILAAGVSEAQLRAFSDQYRGKSVFDRVTIGAARPGYVAVDTISGATITVMVQNQTVMQAARLVAESRGLAAGEAPPRAARAPKSRCGRWCGSSASSASAC